MTTGQRKNASLRIIYVVTQDQRVSMRHAKYPARPFLTAFIHYYLTGASVLRLKFRHSTTSLPATLEQVEYITTAHTALFVFLILRNANREDHGCHEDG